MSKWKKRKGLVAVILVAVFLYLALSLARSFFLKQVGNRLQKSFEIGQIELTYLPPALTIRNLRSKGSNPAISLDSLRVSISILSLFSKEKRVGAEIEHPVVSYNEKVRPVQAKSSSAGGPNWPLDLPLLIESGYVHNGQFSLSLKQGDFVFKGVSAFFRLETGRLNLMLRSNEMSLRPLAAKMPVSGQLETVINTRGKIININRFLFQGEDSALRVEGQINSFQTTKVNLKALFNLDTAFIMSVFNLPFQWAGKATGQARISNETGRLVVDVDYKAPDLSLNQVNLGLVEGQVKVEGGKGGEVLAEIKNSNRPVEKALIRFNSKGVFGEFTGFHLDPIMKYASVPWPVTSPVWGNFALNHGQLTASAEFRDQVEKRPADSGRSFNGLVNVSLNIPQLDLKLDSQDLTSSFGRLNLKGQIVIGKNLDLSIGGQFTDIKEAREFAEKILNEKFGFLKSEVPGARRL